ncbi:hypothetical protein [Curtobacterium sp. PhB137]|uniref:hypothetical protein n=1 Tax=Curtobacterium sp. PhB137 TaxID=2485182 RepID=UPI000F503D36|nr:hypothetical protein [Curtobacterium sp. PhB137]
MTSASTSLPSGSLTNAVSARYSGHYRGSWRETPPAATAARWNASTSVRLAASNARCRPRVTVVVVGAVSSETLGVSWPVTQYSAMESVR